PRGEVHARSVIADVRADTEGESGDVTLARLSDGAPLGRLSGLQSEAMMALRFDPRGSTLLSLCDDDTAVLWSVSSLRALRRFGAMPTTPRDAAICGQGSRVLIVGDDGALRIWRLHGAALESHRAPDGSDVTWAEWDAQGALWITSGRGRVYERPAGERRFVERMDGLGGHAWGVLGPDGVVVASDESGGTRLYDHGRVATLDGWARRRERVVTPDGRRAILIRGADVALVDVATGEDLHVFRGHPARLETAGLSPDGRSIASGDVQGGLRMWDVERRALRWQATHAPGPIYSAVWSPDGRWLVSHGRVDEVVVWDAATGARVAAFGGHRGITNMARFSADGSRIVTAGFADNTAQVWDPATGRSIAVLEGHRARVRVADFDPDGGLVATAGDDSTVRLWDATTGAPLATFGGLDGPVRHLRIAPRGDRVSCVCDDGWLRVYPLDWRVMRRIARRMLAGEP
ncbi:MAG: WD40 repeat domain-containing protein, partial [Myxococcales bacterium]|nr:WD40 repeat domain-containing protein [Myxococcales bacterium]